MKNDIKESVIDTYIKLFSSGEMLKGEKLINECVPLELIDDMDIVSLKKECNQMMNNIKEWSISGRKYPGVHSSPPFDTFPKFTLAKKIILSKYKTGEVLDIGCYSGVFLKEMKNIGFDCTGVDIHEELMNILNKEHKDITFMFSPAEELPFIDNHFDIVTAFDVLEHVLDINKTLSEIERVCESGGIIIVNLPKMTHNYVDDSYEHLRMFSGKDINSIWGNKNSFEIVKCTDELKRDTWFFSYINK